MMSSNGYKYIEEIYDSEEDEIYISEDEEIIEFENDFDFETNANNHYYYYDSNQTILKSKKPFDQKIRQIKKQIKFIQQRIELRIHESIEELNEELIEELAKESNESNDCYLIEDNINNNAINCCQIIDLNKDNTFGHQLSQSLDSKTERTYNELKKVFDYALDDLECEQTFDFDEWYLNLNFRFVDCVLNESELSQNEINFSSAIDQIIRNIQSLNECKLPNEEKGENEVSAQTDINGDIVLEEVFIE